MKFLRKLAAPVAALAIGAAALATPVAGASPITPADIADGHTASRISLPQDKSPAGENSRKWRQVIKNDARVEHVNAYSTAMGRDIPLAVIRAGDNAPTLYLLNGAGGAEQNMDWIARYPELIDFYHSRGVNVVIPQEGAFSYYINWANRGEIIPGNGYLEGKPLWEVFLLRELP